jgi:hypothetical protein
LNLTDEDARDAITDSYYLKKYSSFSGHDRGIDAIYVDTVQTDRYYISSSVMNAQQVYQGIRGYWSIENQLPWSLDVIFREDAAQVCKKHAPENLNALRKMALALLRAAPNPLHAGKKKKTGPKRRFTAAMNSMFSVL